MTRKGSQVQVLYGPPNLISEYALNMHSLASANSSGARVCAATRTYSGSAPPLELALALRTRRKQVSRRDSDPFATDGTGISTSLRIEVSGHRHGLVSFRQVVPAQGPNGPRYVQPIGPAR